MIKKQKSTYTTHIESMTPEQKQKFDEGYTTLLLSEMLLAIVEGDHTAAQKLAELAGMQLAALEKDASVGS